MVPGKQIHVFSRSVSCLTDADTGVSDGPKDCLDRRLVNCQGLLFLISFYCIGISVSERIRGLTPKVISLKLFQEELTSSSADALTSVAQLLPRKIKMHVKRAWNVLVIKIRASGKAKLSKNSLREFP